jgi:DNA-binding response OmpR family regulator
MTPNSARSSATRYAMLDTQWLRRRTARARWRTAAITIQKVILLDLALPQLDGGALFAESYRKLPGARARLLVLSATPHGAETSARIRANAYMSKPFALQELLETVRRLSRLDGAG